MQALKCFLSLIMVCISYVAYGFDYNYTKTVEDQGADYIRQQDIKKDPKFKNTFFTREICNGKTDPNAPNRPTFCVKDFKDIKVQDMGQAIQIAKDYAKKFNNDDITCSKKYQQAYKIGESLADDHIFCSTGYNAKHYEFIFNSVTQTTNDTKYRQGIATAYCRMFLYDNKANKENIDTGYEVYYDSAGNKQTRSTKDKELLCKKPKEDDSEFFSNKCEEMNAVLKKEFGYNAHYRGSSDYGTCTVYFDTKACSTLRTYNGIDNHKFKKLQIKRSDDLVVMLAAYIKNHLKNEVVDTVNCEKAAKLCYTGNTVLNNPNDDYITCYINGKTPIDFQFDDLSETWDTYDKGGRSGLKCVSDDGVFDGKNCHGLNEYQCTALRTKSADNPNPIPTKWDTDLEACLLLDSAAAAKLERGLEIGKNVGVGVLVLGAIIVTGGASAPAMILLAAGGVATAAGSEVITEIERNQIQHFTSELMGCKTQTCLKEKLNWFIETGSGYIGNLTDQSIDAIDDAFAKQMEVLPLTDADIAAYEEATKKSLIQRCGSSALQGTKCALDIATLLLDVVPVTKLATKTIGAFTASFGSKMPKTAKAFIKIQSKSKIVKEGAKVLDKIDTTLDYTNGMIVVSGAN